MFRSGLMTPVHTDGHITQLAQPLEAAVDALRIRVTYGNMMVGRRDAVERATLLGATVTAAALACWDISTRRTAHLRPLPTV